jgi:hypothetical protein
MLHKGGKGGKGGNGGKGGKGGKYGKGGNGGEGGKGGAASDQKEPRLNLVAIELAKSELAQVAMRNINEMIVEVPTLNLPLRPQFASDVLSDLKSLLRVHNPSFSMPVALETADDLAFLEMNDYMVRGSKHFFLLF